MKVKLPLMIPQNYYRRNKKEIKQLRMKMGFVFQGYNLFRNKTALQNVLEGLTVARKIPAEEAKKQPWKS